MRSPLIWFGGKAMQAHQIAELIDNAYADTYVEPFCGGASVFFAKRPHKKEVLNDANHNLINFWEVVRDYADELFDMADVFPGKYKHIFNQAVQTIKDAPDNLLECDKSTRLEQAHCFWMVINFSFAGGQHNSFFALERNRPAKMALLKRAKNRLSNTNILCNDALKTILANDGPDTVFFLDPPYTGQTVGAHYSDVFSDSDFAKLVLILRDIKGKFVMTSQSDDKLHYHEWTVRKTDQTNKINMFNESGEKDVLDEVITTNIKTSLF